MAKAGEFSVLRTAPLAEFQAWPDDLTPSLQATWERLCCAHWTGQVWPKGTLGKCLRNWIKCMATATPVLHPWDSHQPLEKRKILNPSSANTFPKHNQYTRFPSGKESGLGESTYTEPWYCWRVWWGKKLQAAESAYVIPLDPGFYAFLWPFSWNCYSTLMLTNDI